MDELRICIAHVIDVMEESLGIRPNLLLVGKDIIPVLWDAGLAPYYDSWNGEYAWGTILDVEIRSMEK